MAKSKSGYDIASQYAQDGGGEEQQEASQSSLPISADDLSQMQQLKAAGDQSGDYSQLGSYVAQLMGGGDSQSQAAPAEGQSDDNLRESM